MPCTIAATSPAVFTYGSCDTVMDKSGLMVIRPVEVLPRPRYCDKVIEVLSGKPWEPSTRAVYCS
jgi:hypothetical protein